MKPLNPEQYFQQVVAQVIDELPLSFAAEMELREHAVDCWLKRLSVEDAVAAWRKSREAS